MVSLDRWLVGGEWGDRAAARVECPVWGRVFSVVRGFSTLRVVERAVCSRGAGGVWLVEVYGRFSRGVSSRLSFWFDPDVGASLPRLKRCRVRESGGFLRQRVADALYEVSARFPVEIGADGRIYVGGVEVDVWRCERRSYVDVGCVLRQVAERSTARS